MFPGIRLSFTVFFAVWRSSSFSKTFLTTSARSKPYGCLRHFGNGVSPHCSCSVKLVIEFFKLTLPHEAAEFPSTWLPAARTSAASEWPATRPPLEAPKDFGWWTLGQIPHKGPQKTHSCGKNNYKTTPQITINRLYKPFPIGWFIIVLPTLTIVRYCKFAPGPSGENLDATRNLDKAKVEGPQSLMESCTSMLWVKYGKIGYR